MSPPTSKKETQAFLGAIGFWRMHIPAYSQIVSPLYLVTHKKNDFHWGPEQQQAFSQIKQEIAHAVALGPVRTGPEVKNVLYSAAGNHSLSWSLWQKVSGETQGRPLGFWSQSYRGSEANYTPTAKEILASYEKVQATSEVISTEAQLLLAPRLPVLEWMLKGKVPSTHHATNARTKRVVEGHGSTKLHLLFLSLWECPSEGRDKASFGKGKKTELGERDALLLSASRKTVKLPLAAGRVHSHPSAYASSREIYRHLLLYPGILNSFSPALPPLPLLLRSFEALLLLCSPALPSPAGTPPAISATSTELLISSTSLGLSTLPAQPLGVLQQHRDQTALGFL
ncbi:uncharacterized protein LOC134564965 [Prinia subflava]|uniref:uncharacterized protein LOC134564965 n=1 Tax=Prinia subflava TaxID=208062 RepID=UPI002FE2409D